MKTFFTLSLIVLLLVPIYIFSQEPAKINKSGKRPKVGLVLSGGGAKGFAYIGLFKVLKEVGLHVDYVAGTSIGSIMAGFYAAGYDPDTLAPIIRSQDWDAIMQDEIGREYVPFVDKEMGGNLILSFPINPKEKKISLNSSLYEGQNVDMLLNHYFSRFYKVNDFSKLPTPFFCIGTDLFTGDAVELTHGNLVKAIRASMSIPGYFNPTHINNKYLVDGGVVNNYPVKNMKALGVDFVIGGDVQAGLKNNIDELNNLVAVINQIIGFHAVNANEEGMANTDLYIHFDMGKYDMMSFNDYDSIMAIGERVARDHYDELKALADSLNSIEFVAGNKFDTKPLDSIFIEDVKVVGNVNVPIKYFGNYLDNLKNRYVHLSEIEEIIRIMYGSKFFKHVMYELKDVGNDRANLVIDVKETGFGSVSAGIHYDTDYGGSLLLHGNFQNLLIKGSKLFVNLNLGENYRLKTTFIMDRGRKPGLGVTLDFYNFSFGDYERDVKINELRFTNYKFTVFANSTLGNQYNMRLGVDYEYFALNQNINSDSLLTPFLGFNSYVTLFGSFKLDTRDKFNYPTKGSYFNSRLEYVASVSNNWSSELFKHSFIWYINYRGNIALDKNNKFVIQPSVFVGGTFKNDLPPFQHWFGVGGFNNLGYQENIVPFMGTRFIQNFGFYTGVGRLGIQYNVYKKLYLILRDDFGVVTNDLKTISNEGKLLNGIGLTAAYNSFIGPIELTAMKSNVNSFLLYFTVGFWF